MAAETFTKAEMAAAVTGAIEEAYRQSASRIAALEAALAEVLAELADPLARSGTEDPDGILCSNWVKASRVRAWRTVLAGDH